MKLRWYLKIPICLAGLLLLLNYPRLTATQPPPPMMSAAATSEPSAGSWYFTVSGDSRDCGDLIMPKIAQAIADHPTNPAVAFYWHLGDFRALYRVDCDYAKRVYSKSFTCKPKDVSPDQTASQKKKYLAVAWQDFIDSQLGPFKQRSIPVFLGIGNHEMIDRTANHESADQIRAEYRQQFKPWLTQAWIQTQRKADEANNIASMKGDTYYHFIRNGVDFIYLDNADKNAFFDQETAWLFKVLDADAKDDSVKTIIVGMHEALPGSIVSNHAMDDADCKDVCKAQAVYDRLYQAQNLNGPAAKRKHVYLLASHSHLYCENIYKEHTGQVLPGWLIGTAGAEQYQTKIEYGYLQVEVHTDGTITTDFKKVGKTDPPLDSQNSGQALIDYCFGQNMVEPPKAKHDPCPCQTN
jgi:hypothetical protein